MKKLFLSLFLTTTALTCINAQETTEKVCCVPENTFTNQKGDWYVGTGDIDNLAWTQWSVQPTIGYAFADDFMVGLSLNQGTETDTTGTVVAGDINFDVHGRYFFEGFFGYVATRNLTTDFGLDLGVGKIFTTKKNNLFLDPKIVYNTKEGTTNLRLGLGLIF